MKKINGLIKNELKKQYKKISVKVIVILILISSLLLPVGVKLLDEWSNDQWYLENYKNNLTYVESNIESVKNGNSKGEILQRKYYEVEKEKYNILLDNKISYDEWRSESMEGWFYKEIESITIQAILEDYEKDVITNVDYYTSQEDIHRYFEMSKEELSKELKKIKENNRALKDNIIKNDFTKYLEGSIQNSKSDINEEKKLLLELENQFKKEPKNQELEKSIQNLKVQLAINEERLQATQYRYDNKIPYDNNDWRNLTIRDIAYNIDAKGEELLSDEEFNKGYTYEISKGLTYEDYKKNFEDNQQNIKENIELNWYSLKNNIPQIKFHTDARSSIDKIYLIYISVAIILCIIIAGGIVSSEYSTGTIRLLMIRPVSRWKFLTSKLIAVFIIGYIVLIASVSMIILSSGIIYGFSGLSTSILRYSNGAIVEGSYLLSIVPKLLFSSISLIFITAVAFAISTIVKNTALAVGLTTVLYLGSTPATMVLAELKMNWVAKTILPYMNLSTFYSNPYYLDMLKSQYSIILNPVFGAIQLLVLAAILIGISFIVFIKRDMK